MAPISPLMQLQMATSIYSVAAILKVKPSALTYLLYVKDPKLRYTKFEIRKRTGGKREISAPAEDLKKLQRRVADLLLQCIEEIKKIKGYRDTVAHGFTPGRSIVTNAKSHIGRRYVLNVDLTDFFGTFTFPRLYGFLMKDTGFLLPKKAATILAQIACHEGKLPQGSPCSPVISNLIGHILDIHVAKLAAKHGCHYTRYADDLTFSTNKPEFPSAIARKVSETEHHWVVGTQLAGLIKKSAFEINPSKTRMQYCASRQEVTGLTVNKKINARSDYRHLVRSMAHHVLTTGTFHHRMIKIDAAGVATETTIPGNLNQLHGMLGFIDQIDLYNNRLVKAHKYNFPKRASEKLSSKEGLINSKPRAA
jgi:RNA-directed DNA polymerase